MKKVTAIVAAGALSLCLTGCSTQTQEAQEEPQEPVTQTQDAAPTAEEPLAPSSGESDAIQTYFTNPAPEAPAPYIAEGGWTFIESEGGDFVNYALKLACNDPVNCYVSMIVKMTAKGADGSILASQTNSVQFIAPNDVMPVVGTIPLTEESASIDFDLSYGNGAAPGNDYKITDLAVSNTSEIDADTSIKWTGEYTNGTGVDFPAGVYPRAILRENGKIVGGADSSFDNSPVANGETASFEVSGLKGAIPEHDEYELYIVPELRF